MDLSLPSTDVPLPRRVNTYMDSRRPPARPPVSGGRTPRSTLLILNEARFTGLNSLDRRRSDPEVPRRRPHLRECEKEVHGKGQGTVAPQDAPVPVAALLALTPT